MRHGFRIQKHDAYAAFAAVFCPDLETSPDLHSCDRNWNFWLPKSPKKKLPKCWFLNFHQIITTWTAWIFPGIKKNTWPFMAIYRTNQKVSCFFPKIWTPTQKIRIHLQQKNMFLIQFHPFETCWSKSQNAHAHLFGTEAWVKCLWWWLLSLVTMAGICRGILGAQGMFGSLFATKQVLSI